MTSLPLFVFFFSLVFSIPCEDDGFTHKYITLPNDLTIHYVEANPHLENSGQPRLPTVVLLHGFPEFWYSWRHQIHGLSAKGYHVLALDQRGYGESDKPFSQNAYDIPTLTKDIVLFLDSLNLDKVHLVGHDWGSVVAWWSAYLYPLRFFSVTSLSIPWGVLNFPLSYFVEEYGEDFYVNQFQKVGVVEEYFDENLKEFLILAFSLKTGPSLTTNPLLSLWKQGANLVKQYPGAVSLAPWVTETDLQKYIKNYKKNGITPPLNYYRNWDRNFLLLKEKIDSGGYFIEIPSKLIMGERDAPFLKKEEHVNSKYLKNYDGITWLNDCGHFTQMEKPEEVNLLLVEFFEKVDKKEKVDL